MENLKSKKTIREIVENTFINLYNITDSLEKQNRLFCLIVKINEDIYNRAVIAGQNKIGLKEYIKEMEEYQQKLLEKTKEKEAKK